MLRLTLYQKEIDKSPAVAGLYIGLARTYLQLKQLDQAQATLQKGLEHKVSTELYVELGDLSFLRGDYVCAAAAFESAGCSWSGQYG